MATDSDSGATFRIVQPAGGGPVDSSSDAGDGVPVAEAIAWAPPGLRNEPTDCGSAGSTQDLLLDGRYRLAELVGQGSSAAVYRGTDLLLGRTVALKIFHPQTEEPAFLARQHAEMVFLAGLNHPNLVSIYDAGMTVVGTASGNRDSNAVSYLVMEFIDGMSLEQQMRRGAMSPDDVADLGAAVASALAVVHIHGLVHRDVKPANILLPTVGGARLTDFGIARMLNSPHLTSSAQIVGTPLYLSPEQARGDEVGPATDIYSLALVLLECLTGCPEFTGNPVQSAMARLLRDPRVPATLPAPWPELLPSMTNAIPTERPTADVVAATLTGYLNNKEQARTATTVTAQVPASPGRPSDTSAHQPTPVAAMATKKAMRKPISRIVLLCWSFALTVMTAVTSWSILGHLDHPDGPTATANTPTRTVIVGSTTTRLVARYPVEAIQPPAVLATITRTAMTTRTQTSAPESSTPLTTTSEVATAPTTTSETTTVPMTSSELTAPSPSTGESTADQTESSQSTPPLTAASEIPKPPKTDEVTPPPPATTDKSLTNVNVTDNTVVGLGL